MSDKYIQLFRIDSDIDNAFLVVSGDVLLFLNESDKYAIKGANFVIGASELLLRNNIGLDVNRMETAVIHDSTKIKKISSKNFMESIKNYSFILNVSMVIAKQVVLTNNIISRFNKELTGGKTVYRISCIGYYKIISGIKEEYEKRKFPWLKEVLDKYESSVTFKKGEIFNREDASVKIIPSHDLDSKRSTYPKGSIICEEGKPGDSIFILQDGVIDVLVNGNRVASISEKGTSIGEIALLLGEPRTATLKAKNDVSLTKLDKSDLKEVAEKDINVLIGIANSLAQKHYNNVQLVKSLNDKKLEENLNSIDEEYKREIQSQNKCITSFGSLKREVSELIYHKKADFLQDRFTDYLD
ncbi:MAG: cyclic nucleotide-binding domain-containing protein [Spirochaetes bacterium]|nr:cyclic nucleotide-binding domain-containing protein [Spirochaetota bacterium]